jgi:hypothetical protein
LPPPIGGILVDLAEDSEEVAAETQDEERVVVVIGRTFWLRSRVCSGTREGESETTLDPCRRELTVVLVYVIVLEVAA